eukprot:11586167-Ditylum_brightwellii.AAC.1
MFLPLLPSVRSNFHCMKFAYSALSVRILEVHATRSLDVVVKEMLVVQAGVHPSALEVVQGGGMEEGMVVEEGGGGKGGGQNSGGQSRGGQNSGGKSGGQNGGCGPHGRSRCRRVSQESGSGGGCANRKHKVSPVKKDGGKKRKKTVNAKVVATGIVAVTEKGRESDDDDNSGSALMTKNAD